MIRQPALVYRGGKRTLDVLVSASALVILAPLMLAIAILVKLQDPRTRVVFRQRRCGYGGRQFELLKFRTMVSDADAWKEQLRERSIVAWPDFRVTEDPRVTWIGRILRRTSLDELPQLLNVLRGDMSLVGPRPTSFMSDTYRLWQTGRLDFKPGLTGPWQVYGRSTMNFEERCRLDISFFRSPSLCRELWMIMLTVVVVLRRTGVA